MSETLCTLRTKGGGGGKYTETVLWTNSAPSSAFAAQTVTISDSIDNYKYIAIKYKFDTSSSVEGSVIFLVSDIKKSVQGVDTIVSCIGASPQGVANYARRVFYVSNTEIRIETAAAMNRTGTSTAYVIPTEILGLNELSTEPVIMKKIGEISLPAGTATVTGNLSENISDYKNLLVSMVEYNGSSIPLTGIGSTILGFFTSNYFASNNPVGYYGIGNQGSISYYSVTMQKMSDTSIKFTRNNTTGARTAYVYGIK